ncbi:MAG: Hin recombinase [Anaerolineae bacterium]|nr:Hin recombinase [Anaerolineae bacterium]
MKPEQREAARRLRQQGWSVNEIMRELGVSKSSVSLWVRDIPLTAEQERALHDRHGPRYHAQANGSKAVAAKYREQRSAYQAEGRAQAREMDPLHIAGCMLYWAEGKKRRNTLAFTNSDPGMIQFYVDRFLRECLHIPDEAITIYLNCYLGNDLTQNDIENYWLTLLGLPRSCLRTVVVNAQPSSSSQRGRKLKYGICEVDINQTRYVQHVYGAIQEYSGIDYPEWLH